MLPNLTRRALVDRFTTNSLFCHTLRGTSFKVVLVGKGKNAPLVYVGDPDGEFMRAK